MSRNFKSERKKLKKLPRRELYDLILTLKTHIEIRDEQLAKHPRNTPSPSVGSKE
jgi:hypothetical protein